MARKKKVLYVEDDLVTKAVVRKILEPQGYEVLEAEDGLSGVNIALSEELDLVLMDIAMPGLDGLETSTLLRGLPSMEDVPIVAYTAKSITEEDREQLFGAGCDGFIPKTCTTQELLAEVKAYLNGKREKLGNDKRKAGVQAYQQHLVERLQEQINKLTQVNEELTLRNRMDQAIASTLNLNELLALVTRLIKENMEVQTCVLMLFDEKSDEFVFEAVSGQQASELKEHRMEPCEGTIGWYVLQGEAVFTNDLQNDPRFKAGVEDLFDFQIQSVLCVPLKVAGKVIGAIEAINKSKGQFDQSSLRLLNSLASRAALAIENARLYRNLQEERDHLIRKEEEIRRSIARDLHDGPTQMLSAVSMNIEFIRKLLEIAPDRVEKEMETLQRLANEAAHDVRTLLFGLHPTVLETRGLKAALEVYTDRFQDRGGMRLFLDAPHQLEEFPLSKEAEIVAFIIVQEAVNNAKKHSKSPDVFIRLRQKVDRLVINVEDEGQGFNPKEIKDYNKKIHFGLTTMAERAKLVNADFEIHSVLGEGTTITLSIPLIEKKERASTEETEDS